MSANISLSRGKSLRLPPSNTLKPPPSTQQQLTVSTGPSNIALFLTNLRLLDFDLRDDWPDITAVTFSTKDAQQNQKKRIQCVEWALYQLFAIWDPDETRNKLQPFFPPLEHLQSLNLRTALFRCLDQAKKNGLLGRDTVLRKTMLDECKGERLEEILALFSTAVLKKVVQERDIGHHEAIARALAMENFSYTGERKILSSLILAHKLSLSRSLTAKNESKARYKDFADLLNLKERQTTRRHEQLKVSIGEECSITLSGEEAQVLRDRVRKNWSGSNEWLEIILHGDNGFERDELLATPFDKVWTHVEGDNISDIEDQEQKGLLEQLNARVRQQNQRLAKWQDFESSLSKDGNIDKPGKKKSPDLKERSRGIDLGFNRHEPLQLARSPLKTAGDKVHAPFGEYARLIENMQMELLNVGKPRRLDAQPTRRAKVVRKEDNAISMPAVKPVQMPVLHDDGHSSPSGIEEDKASPADGNRAAMSTSQSPPSEYVADGEGTLPTVQTLSLKTDLDNERASERLSASSATRCTSNQSTMPPPSPPTPGSSPLASEILASVLTTSPSPTKPRHVLSLAERARHSMSRTSTAKSNFHLEDFDDDLPDLTPYSLPQKSKRTSKLEPVNANKPSSSAKSNTQHEDLIARTRQSMSNFGAVQKSAQLDRRQSTKLAARNKRESRNSHFPKPLETATEDDGVMLDGLDKKALIEGEAEADYEAVFKSRPRIKTSPERSPERSPVKAWGDMGARDGMDGSSSPLSGGY